MSSTHTPFPAEVTAAQVAIGHRRLEEVDRLGDAIAELSARIQAATYDLLVLIREFDDREGWNTGFPSCAHWLNWRTGLALGVAREKVRVARALGDLPRLSAASSRGELSYSKVRALTRVATAENESALLDFARCATAAHVERLARAWRRVDRVTEAADERRRHESRHLETWVDDDGTVVVRGRLSPEAGAVVRRALDAASERLYTEATDATDTTVGQRRADAMGLVAESALAADLDPGSAADRYQVVVHVDEETLRDESAAGQSAVEDPDGLHVSAGTSRRMACDAATVTMRHGRDGLDVGRKTRSVPPAIRRALTARDRHCAFPGCRTRHCDAHHIWHWAEGGATKLDNLVLLCRRHHRAVHEEGVRVLLPADGPARFFRADGKPLPEAPPAPGWSGAPLAPTVARLETEGLSIDGKTATPHWFGEPFDLGYAIDVLWRQRAMETSAPDVPAGTSRPLP